MGGGDRCTVGGCNNDRRYPHLYKIRSHVHELKFHSLPTDPVKRENWIKAISRARADFVDGKYVRVCSNHFVDAGPTYNNPIPTLFMNKSDLKYQNSPVKRRPISKRCLFSANYNTPMSEKKVIDIDEEVFTLTLSFASIQLSREADVQFYTGLGSTDIFKTLFDHLKSKAVNMQYWKGEKQTTREMPERYDNNSACKNYQKPGPDRKLKLELEFLLVLMRLRLGLLVHDLACRFQISDASVSSIFFTWIRLMRLELSNLIIWPCKEDVKENLPECFKRYYPRVRCIIDCTEVYIEKPSSLDVQAQCYSEYKHHNTFIFLIAITPNGAVSYVSPCYGGRASDAYIFRDCGFLNLIEPHDQIMADRGFKIKDDLVMVQASLAIPPSTTGTLALTTAQVKQTSMIANIRIYVEQAIGRIKVFRFLKNEFPITCLPICDDCVIVCAALCNLLEPFCD